MYYLICFIAALVILLFTIVSEKNLKTNTVLLIIVTIIGDGGYYALSSAETLDRAVLANTLSYAVGIFGPMLFFFNILDICKVKLPSPAVAGLYGWQILLFLSVCTVGKLPIFYKTVEYHTGIGGAYLTKTYGFAHSAYLVMMILYYIAAFAVSFYFSRKKNIVSTLNVDILLFVFLLLAASYIMGRVIHLEVELMPFIYTLGIAVMLVPILKLSRYSVETSAEIMQESMKSTGYILFTNKLAYVGCNAYAKELFPELSEWELEKKIPGNGGRFNTFLRPSFLRYVDAGLLIQEKGKPFSLKEESYSLELSRLHHGRRAIGYIIKITNVTEFAGKE